MNWKERLLEKTGGREGARINGLITLIFSTTAVIGVIILFIIFNMFTTVRVKEITTSIYVLIPTLSFTFWIQLLYNYRKFKPIARYLYLKETERLIDEDLISRATISILEFPLKASTVSFLLWLTTGITLVVSLKLILNTATPKLLYIMVAVFGGASAAYIFLYYLFKLPLKRTAFALLSTRPGKKIQEEYRLISTRTKLIMTIILIIFSTISIFGLLSYSKSISITIKEEKRIAREIFSSLMKIGDKDKFLKKFAQIAREFEISTSDFDVFLYDMYKNKFYFTNNKYTPGELQKAILSGNLEGENIKVPRFQTVTFPLLPEYIAVVQFPSFTSMEIGKVVWIILILAFISIALSIFLLNYFSSEISRPIARTKEFVKYMREGDLTKKIFIVSDDELSFIAQLLRSYRDSTIRIVKTIYNYASSLEKETDLLSDATDNLQRMLKETPLISFFEKSREFDSTLSGTQSQMIQSINTLNSLYETTKLLKVSVADLFRFNEETLTLLNSLDFEYKTAHKILSELSGNMNSLLGTVDQIEKQLSELINTTNTENYLMNNTSQEAQQLHDHQVTFRDETKKLLQSLNNLETLYSEMVNDLVNFRKNLEKAKEMAVRIGTISENSELISFNASIIAVSASYYFKEFSIISDELRDLTQRTLGITEGIKEKVDWISYLEGEIYNRVDISSREFKDLLSTISNIDRNNMEAHAAIHRIESFIVDSRNFLDVIEDTLREIESGFWKGRRGIEGFSASLNNLESNLTEVKEGIQNLFNINLNLKDALLTIQSTYEGILNSFRKISLIHESSEKLLGHLTLTSRERNNILGRVDDTLTKLDNQINAIIQYRNKLKKNISTLKDIYRLFKW